MTDADHGHGRYYPIAELGQGGTANVFLAVARGPSDFNKLVVLKVLKHELAHEHEFRSMFMNEARLAARLNHPNVVQTNEVMEVDGRPVLVMEYLEGQTLSRILARSRDAARGGVEMPLSLHLRVLIDVLSGLHYSHELIDYDGTPLRVVHRDMTPHNVFVSYDGRVCILDFGIAKLTGLGLQETQTGVIKGKLRYMPAEQVLGLPLDRRADLFAVGVMLWEAAAREKMWRGLSDAAIMHNVLHGLIPSPRTIRPDISPELERICMKALAHDKDQRYHSAAELQADLEGVLSQESYANRAIGKYVSELFADSRLRMKGLIESQLAGIGGHSPSLSSVSAWHLLPPTTLSRPRQSITEDSQSRVTELEQNPPGAGRRPWAKGFAAVGVAAAVFMLLWQMTKQEQAAAGEATQPEPLVPALPVEVPPPRPDPAPQPAEPQPAATGVSPDSVAAAAPAVEVPAEIQLHISVSPDSARIYLDGKKLRGNPHTLTVPADDEEHTLRVEALGYEAQTRTIAYNQNMRIELALRRYTQPSRSRSNAADEAAKKDRDDEAEDRCAMPFYLDERGIRRLKRECL
jgi:serine/threonine protein kinase